MKFLSIIFFMFFISHIQGNKVAVTTKVKGLVEIMPVGQENFSNLKPGTILADGDRIRTGSSGFTAIIFIQDVFLHIFSQTPYMKRAQTQALATDQIR